MFLKKKKINSTFWANNIIMSVNGAMMGGGRIPVRSASILSYHTFLTNMRVMCVCVEVLMGQYTNYSFFSGILDDIILLA